MLSIDACFKVEKNKKKKILLYLSPMVTSNHNHSMILKKRDLSNFYDFQVVDIQLICFINLCILLGTEKNLAPIQHSISNDYIFLLQNGL